MTTDYRKLNKVTPPLHAALPSVPDFMDRFTIRLGTYCYVVDLEIFSINIEPESQEQFAITWDGHQ